jgi:hypothetical protein
VRRLLVLVPLAAVALVAVAAFTSRGGFEGDAVAAAATKTGEAGSSRVAIQLTGNVLGRDVSLRGQGAFDYEAARGSFRLDASSLLSGAAVEVRAVDSTLYVRVPAGLSFFLPSVKPWLALQGDTSLDAFGLGELQQNPGELLTLLRASSTRVTKTGAAVVRGTETTRYTAQLDLAKALEANAGSLGLTATEREQLRRAADELRRQAKQTSVPVGVFVDDDGFVRRLTVASDGERVTVDFWDFGANVDVQAPPAADVTDASQLLRP